MKKPAEWFDGQGIRRFDDLNGIIYKFVGKKDELGRWGEKGKCLHRFRLFVSVQVMKMEDCRELR